VNLEIARGHVIDPANNVNRVTNLFIGSDRIVGIDASPPGFVADRTLDAHGLIVIPGLVDIAARLREPGQEHKATIASETRAAVSAGITSLCCPPDTIPVIDSPAEVQLIQQRAQSAGNCRVFTIGALTAELKGQTLSELAALKRAGCVGVSNALRPMATPLILRRAMEYAASQGLTVFLHPFDHALANHGCAHEGAVATRLGLPGIPTAAETAAMGQLLALVEQTGVRAHFCRLSTTRAVNMFARARFDGLPLSADVCAHQLFLTQDAIGEFNSLCHTVPPLRTKEDMEGLRQAVARGAVSAICSDHQPHDMDAKLAPFAATEPGISALETLLPLTLRLVEEGVLTLTQAVARITAEPALVLGINAGSLSVGAPADICIYSSRERWTLTPQSLLSRGKNTPFLGCTLTGRVTNTMVGGRMVYQSDLAQSLIPKVDRE
jgi:dihydroorotase